MSVFEILYTIVYASIYVVMFITYYNRKIKANTCIMLLLMWMVSAIAGVIYEQNQIFFHYHKITFFPYIYLFIFNFITFIPLFCNNETKVVNIQYSNKSIHFFSLLIIIVTIPCFFENIIYLLRTGFNALNAEMIAERYSDVSSTFDYLSKPVQNLMRISSSFGFILPILFFHLLAIYKKISPLLIGLGLCILNYVLSAFNTGQRSLILNLSIMFLFVFLFYKKFIDSKVLRQLYKWGAIVVSAIFVVFVSITIIRFYSYSFSEGTNIWLWIVQYAGESHGNFNADMWYVEKYSNSDIVTKIFKKYFLGIDFAVRDYSQGGLFPDVVKCVQFYTTVGTFYGGYGSSSAAIIIILSSLFFLKITQMHKQTTFSTIVVYVFYARIPLIGFCCFAYAPDVYQMVVFPFVVFFLKMFEKFSGMRIVNTN